MEEILRGAEASIRKEKGDIVKDRAKKGYRNEILDRNLREQRTKIESSIMISAKRAGIPVPSIKDATKTTITMEFIEGGKLKDVLDSLDSIEEISETIGSYVGRLHRNGIIHGDLTTSNMILSDKLYFIDFGLAFSSFSVEDRAVDLYVLYKAIESTHLKNYNIIWNSIIDGYKKEYNESEETLKRLEKIKERGRYKTKDLSIPDRKIKRRLK